MKSETWAKTRYANLVRYVPSGTYFIRAKVNGKLIRETLETKVETVARLKLAERLTELRNLPVVKNAARMTFAEAADLYRAAVAGDRELKPLSKSYRRDTLAAILRTWPELEITEMKRITAKDCEGWASRYSDEYSASRFNGTIQTLRAVFDLAIKQGAIAANPAKGLKAESIQQKELTLPSQAQFLKVLAALDSNPMAGCSADLVRLLAFSGMRKSEARNFTWADVDFDKRQIRVKGDPEHGTKNWERRTVPMIDDLKALLDRLAADNQTGRVVPQNECRYSLDAACKAAGCERITHHDLRHLFATRCIESGVDIPTVSRWLGHKDGGALAMKTYGHLRDDHSAAMAQRVSFSTKKEAV